MRFTSKSKLVLSAAVALTSLSVVGLVKAEENVAETPILAVENPTREDGAIENAKAEIQSSQQVEVTPGSQTPGDVVAVDHTISPEVTTVVEVEAGVQTTKTSTETVKTTSVAPEGDLVGGGQPQVEVTTSTSTVDGVTLTEKVTKTTTVDIQKGKTSVNQEVAEVDLVFMLDNSGSMRNSIDEVRAQVTTLVKNFREQGLSPRLGLVSYARPEIGGDNEFFTFNGSYFTTDENELIAAMDSISVVGGGFEYFGNLLRDKVIQFDWSDTASEKPVFVLTDTYANQAYGMPGLGPVEVFQGVTYREYDAEVPALQAAGLTISVIGELEYEEKYANLINGTGGRFIDIRSDFATTLSQDAVCWITERVENATAYKVVTEEYVFETVSLSQVGKTEDGQLIYKAPAKTSYVHLKEIPEEWEKSFEIEVGTETASDLEVEQSTKSTENSLPQTGGTSSLLSLLGFGLLSSFGLAKFKIR